MFDEDSRVYKLYISHINQDDKEYRFFLSKLNASYDFQWVDAAVQGKILPEEITNQMEDVDLVIILSGLCSKNKKLVTLQLNIALKLGKPIVVIRPYGMENIPYQLEEIADEVVGWNTPCIVDAIKDALGDS